jgi:hypothetical protein
MKRILLFLSGILFIAQLSYSQEIVLASQIHPELKYYPLKGEVFFSAYKQIKGNPYLTGDWVTGSICLKNGQVMNNIKYKFDVYQHRLIVYQEFLKRLVIPEKQDIESFKIIENGTVRNFKCVEANLTSQKTLTQNFLEVLMEGKVSFYRLYSRQVLPLRTPEMPYIDEFIELSDYYLFYQGKYEIARLRKSYLINRFPQFKSEIKHYARGNRLKLRHDHDFAIMIGYLSQLIELTAK